MPAWLRNSFNVTVAWDELTVRLVVALLLGLVIVGVYRYTRLAPNVTASFPATLVLLTVLIAMVTQVIGDNTARAFSLVGVLSIVRFRTAVRDSKDTAFVVFAVVVGMAVGAGQPVVALCGMGTVALAAIMFRDRPHALGGGPGYAKLRIRLVWSESIEAALLAMLGRHAQQIEPSSVAVVRGGAAIELCYRVRLAHGASATRAVVELQQLEGVQTVELRGAEDSD
jgi:uncharacterized membrane protein YhiD involved in acid resistance